MKKRNIPYGYRFVDGMATLKPNESEIVKQIYKEYVSGKSLLKISQQLNDNHIEYMPGVIGWDKSRIKRIVEDKRYLGTELYPPIIEAKIYAKAQELKNNRNTQRNTDRQDEIYKINVPIKCPKCNGQMFRRNNRHLQNPQKWICKNDKCQETIDITDEELLAALTELLSNIKPDMIKEPIIAALEPDTDILRLNNEISKALDSNNIDTIPLREKIIECANLKYCKIDNSLYITKRLQYEFEKNSTKKLSELLNNTVDEIRLYTDKTVAVVLRNRQYIGRKEIYNGTDYICSSKKNSTNN